MKKILLSLTILLFLGSCTKVDPLHIGSKEFTEQLILAEMIAQLAEQSQIPVKRSIPYGDTFSNLEAVKTGDLDMYVEYNGTGLIMLGQPPINDGDKAFDEVKKLFKPLKLEWLDRLGFANNYVLLMRRDLASNLRIKKISDLLKIQPTVRLAAEPEFIERPLDGLAALQRRYGLNHIVATVVNSDVSTIYQALLDNKVDVAEGFSTDGRIEDFGLTVLQDDLQFFPVYEPSPLVREEALDRFPKLRMVLQRLADTIDTKSMRQMNREVELEGQDYQTVAQNFLIQHNLISTRDKSLLKKEELIMATGLLDEPSGGLSKALRAVRKTFPGRQVKTIQVSDPIQSLLKGQSRLAIVNAEAFFKITRDMLPVPEGLMEAVGVVGSAMAHLLISRDGQITALKDIQKLGVNGGKSGISTRSAKMILTSLGFQDQVTLSYEDNLNDQIESLQKQHLDGILLMVPLHHEQLAGIMSTGRFKLLSLREWQEGNNLIRFPFFRLARIPANSYDGQPDIVETISTQMVLAGPLPVSDVVGNRGPATVISAYSQPLSDPVILKLNKALGSGEKLDPTLPSAEVLKPQTKAKSNSLNPSKSDSIFNFFIIAAIFFFFHLLLRKDKEEAKPDSPATSTSIPRRPKRSTHNQESEV